MDKIAWSGRIISVQPRIRLTRSFDQRSHSYLGYCLFIDGLIGEETREFSIAIGKSAQEKYQSLPMADERLEPVEFYKTSKMNRRSR